jgi:hypothetical protein
MQTPCDLESGYPGQFDIHQRHVWPLGMDEFDRGLAGRYLTDDAHVVGTVAYPAQQRADHSLIVCDEYLDHLSCSLNN